MTAFVPAPGVIQMATIFSLVSQKIENTYHYHFGGTITRALLSAMATTYINWFTTHENLFSNQLGLTLIYLRDLTTQTSLTLDFVPTATLDGNRTSPALPNNVTLAIKRETGLAGRSNRGRVYWAGLTLDMLSDTNHVILSTASALAGSLNTLLASELSDNGVQEVILHRKLGTFTNVFGYTVTDESIDSQRRRLPDHNIHH